MKAAVVDALAFRLADRHVTDLLSDAGDATYDILEETGHIDEIAIESVQEGLAAARARLKAAGMPCTLEYQRAFAAIKSTKTTALMGEYLADEHFGELAARVLAVQWSESNEPRNDTKFHGGVDFTHVERRRAARAADSAKSSTEADMIFGVVDTLIADGSTEQKKMLAVTLGIIGAMLPHGRRNTTIQNLIALAPRPARANLLLSLILSGEDVAIELIADGIAETFEAAKKETWILDQGDAYQIRAWLRLLPFATPVSELPAVMGSMPDAWRNPNLLEDVIEGLGSSPSPEAEAVLFKLAEEDPRFYLNHQWRTTVLRLGTASSTPPLGRPHGRWRAERTI